MSFKAMAWASNQKTGNSTRKLILLLLADRANDKGFCWPSMNTIAEDCELTREAVSRNIKALEKDGFLRVVREKQNGVNLPNKYYLNIDGGVGYDEVGVPYENHNGSDLKSHKPINEPVNNNIVEIKEIIDYLNSRAGKSYRASTEKTKRLIRARLREAFTVEDFKRVIDTKCDEWLGTNMNKYLRPETLFGTKFESYLNESKSTYSAWYDSPEYQ